MKTMRFLALLLLCALLISSFAACSPAPDTGAGTDAPSSGTNGGTQTEGEGNGGGGTVNDPPKELTDEEKIAKQVNTFAHAYNSGDWDTLMGCLNVESRNTLRISLEMFESIFGTLLGFELDLKDYFSLGAYVTEEDFMSFKIDKIDVADDKKTAVVTAHTDIAGGDEQILIFEMVYEYDGWYIGDVLDKAPAAAEGDAYVASAGEFIDDYAWIQYAYSDAQKYYAFIDKNGNVLYSEAVNGQSVYNIGKGSGIIYADKTLKLIDSTGAVICTMNGAFDVVVAGGGYALLYENRSNISEVMHMYGVIDHTGSMVHEFAKYEKQISSGLCRYVGDAMFAIATAKYTAGCKIYNFADGSMIQLSNLNSIAALYFENGYAYIGMNMCSYEWERVTSDKIPDGVSITKDFLLGTDGSASLFGGALIDFKGTMGIRKSGDYYDILSGEDPKSLQYNTFKSFPADQIYSCTIVGNYCLMVIRGMDSKNYITVLDKNANMLYSPICYDNFSNVSTYAIPTLYKDGTVLFGERRVDKNGNITEFGWNTTSNSVTGVNGEDYVIKRGGSTLVPVYEYYKTDGTLLFTLHFSN